VTELVPIDHDRFRRADRAIFVRRVVADCMAHACRVVRDDRAKLDACCGYGVDVDLAERDAILARKDELAAILTPAARAAPWFDGPERIDPDFPSGRHVRTATLGDGCVFLAHDGRGCAIHRASIEGGWDFHGTKPHVCRLFPLSYAGDAIVLSDDYPDYSCAEAPGSPTVYRVARDTIGAVFGVALVAALDRAEARVVAADDARPAGLRVVG
jgi:Fe-S-cluster containining protein